MAPKGCAPPKRASTAAMARKRCAPMKCASAAAMTRKRCAPTKRASAAAMAPKHSAASSPSPALVISSESSSEEEEDKEVTLVISSAAAAAAAAAAVAALSDEESEASEEEEEEAGDEMPQAAPNQEMVRSKGAKRPSVPYRYRPPPIRFESETSDEEEEEEEEEEVNLEMPQAKPAPNQEMAAQGAKLRGALFQRSAPPSEDQGRRLFDDLSKNVCPSSSKAAAAANRGAGRELDEMCELYPCLTKEVKAIEKGRPGLFMREFLMMDDSKARALEEEIKEERKKWRHMKMRLQMKVANTLMDLAP